MKISENGLEYRYCKNPDAKHTLVILTGANVTVEDNRWLQDRLAKQYNVLNYNRGGYGNSVLNSQRRDLDTIIDELKQLLDELALKDVIFLGPSLGGYYARYYNHLYPAHVKAMVAVDTPISNTFEKIRPHLPTEHHAVAQKKLDISFPINPIADAERADIFQHEFADFDYHQTPTLLFYNTDYGELTEMVSELVLKQSQQEVADQPNVALRYSNVGHDIITHDPTLFFTELDAFINRL